MTRAMGPLLTEWPLKREAARIVRQYTGFYSDEIARQQEALGFPIPSVGRGARVKRLRSVTVRERAIRLPEEQLPAIVLAIPGTADVGYHDAPGNYSASWRLEIHSAVSSTDADVGGELAAVLSLAAAKALLAGLPGSLAGRIGAVDWAGKGSRELEPDAEQRSRHTSVHVLLVDMNDVIADSGDLPDLPDGDELTDPGDLPLIEHTANTTTPVQEI
jgi:hypothetical protein